MRSSLDVEATLGLRGWLVGVDPDSDRDDDLSHKRSDEVHAVMWRNRNVIEIQSRVD